MTAVVARIETLAVAEGQPFPLAWEDEVLKVESTLGFDVEGQPFLYLTILRRV